MRPTPLSSHHRNVNGSNHNSGARVLAGREAAAVVVGSTIDGSTQIYFHVCVRMSRRIKLRRTKVSSIEPNISVACYTRTIFCKIVTYEPSCALRTVLVADAWDVHLRQECMHRVQSLDSRRLRRRSQCPHESFLKRPPLFTMAGSALLLRLVDWLGVQGKIYSRDGPGDPFRRNTHHL